MLTRPYSQIRNSWLGFASLHILANYYLPLKAALYGGRSKSGFDPKRTFNKEVIWIGN